MKWNKIEDGNPGLDGSDQYYLVVLHNKLIKTSYFFCDTFGGVWEVCDKCYNDGEVTHWANLPSLPE